MSSLLLAVLGTLVIEYLLGRLLRYIVRMHDRECSRCSSIANCQSLSGYEIARDLLADVGASDIPVLSDSRLFKGGYDSRNKVLYLSSNVIFGPSVVVWAIGGHEVGHAMQDTYNWRPFRLQTALISVANSCHLSGFILSFIGLVLRCSFLSWVGVGLLGLVLVQSLLTLLMELDASRRALQVLRANYLLSRWELGRIRRILGLATLTYVVGVTRDIAIPLFFASLLLYC